MDLSFLPKSEQRVAAMLICGGALIFGGWKLRDLIGDAQAAEARVGRLERTVRRMDRNMVRVATRLNVEIESEPEVDVPTVSTGVAR